MKREISADDGAPCEDVWRVYLLSRYDLGWTRDGIRRFFYVTDIENQLLANGSRSKTNFDADFYPGSEKAEPRYRVVDGKKRWSGGFFKSILNFLGRDLGILPYNSVAETRQFEVGTPIDVLPIWPITHRRASDLKKHLAELPRVVACIEKPMNYWVQDHDIEYLRKGKLDIEVDRGQVTVKKITAPTIEQVVETSIVKYLSTRS